MRHTPNRFQLFIFPLFTAGVAFSSSAFAAAESDLMIVKKRYLQLIAPKELDPGRPEVRRLYRNLAYAARRIMKTQILYHAAKNRGTWKEVTIGKDGPDGDAFGRYHFNRMRKLAQAYGTPGSKLKGDKEVLRHITAALEFCEPYIRGGGKRKGNWWAWDVGIPGRLADTLLLTEGALPKTLYKQMKAALLSLVKKRYPDDYKSGGANVLYVALNQLRTAMVTGKTEYAANAAASCSAMSAIGRDMGIQPDYSYHFHGHGLNMGYGREKLTYVSRFLYLTAGTSLALSKKALKIHEDWFKEFIVWNSWRGRVSPFSIGRSIARDGAVERATELEAAVFLYLCRDCSCRDLALSFIGEWYRANADKKFITPALSALAPRFESALPKAKPMPTGTRFYPLSDYLTCRKNGFYAAVRMSSTRTKASFSIREENLRARQSGDGTLVLMTDGSEWDNEVIPTMNWDALSGVTAAYGFKVPAEHPGYSETVGGLSHRGRWGVAAMDFLIRRERDKAALRAMKSYTVLDKGVVLLGTGIRLESAKPAKGKTVYTSIHQCPLRDSDRTVVVNGKPLALKVGKQRFKDVSRLHVRNYGYYFPKPCTVDLTVRGTTRGYKYINGRYFSDKKYTRRFYTISIDHGPQPKNGKYAVVVFPNVTVNEMRTLTGKSNPYTVRTSGHAHAVSDGKAGVTICCFFGKDEIDGFQADRPLVAAASTEGEKVYVTVQDPTHRGGKVTLRIPYQVSGPRTRSAVKTKPDDGGTFVTVELDKGFPLALELKKK